MDCICRNIIFIIFFCFPLGILLYPTRRIITHIFCNIGDRNEYIDTRLNTPALPLFGKTKEPTLPHFFRIIPTFLHIAPSLTLINAVIFHIRW